MATTFDTEREAEAVAAELNAAAGRDVRYHVERYREKWAIARQSRHITGLGTGSLPIRQNPHCRQKSLQRKLRSSAITAHRRQHRQAAGAVRAPAVTFPQCDTFATRFDFSTTPLIALRAAKTRPLSAVLGAKLSARGDKGSGHCGEPQCALSVFALVAKAYSPLAIPRAALATRASADPSPPGPLILSMVSPQVLRVLG